MLGRPRRVAGLLEHLLIALDLPDHIRAHLHLSFVVMSLIGHQRIVAHQPGILIHLCYTGRAGTTQRDHLKVAQSITAR